MLDMTDRYDEEWLANYNAKRAQPRNVNNNQPLIILGVDPGMSGGIARLKQEGASWYPSALPMPSTERAIVDYLWSLHQEARKEEIEIICFLEHIQPMPIIKRSKGPKGETREEVNPGLNQIGNFMKHYGFLRGCLISIGIPVEDIRPQAWQKLLGCMTRGNKNVSKAKAQQLFPTLQVTHKIADALLIAEAGRKIRMGLSAGALFEASREERMPWEK
jgi:hypothetical protein